MARPPKAPPAPLLPASPAAALAAYGRVEPKLVALGPDDLVTVYVEVPKAVSAVLAALPHLRELRDEIVRDLPNHPIEMLDELEDYALAAWYADLLYSTPTSDADTKKLTEEASSLREAVNRLPEDEREVIHLRFGTGGDGEHTLVQAARRLGMPPSKARQAEERALRRLAADGDVKSLRVAA